MREAILICGVIGLVIVSVLHILHLRKVRKTRALMLTWADGLVGSMIRGSSSQYEFPRYLHDEALEALSKHRGVKVDVREEGVILSYENKTKFLPHSRV